MITTHFSPLHFCGSDGWQWQLLCDGRCTRWGWSSGKLKDAEQDCDEALRKMTARAERTVADEGQMEVRIG